MKGKQWLQLGIITEGCLEWDVASLKRSWGWVRDSPPFLWGKGLQWMLGSLYETLYCRPSIKKRILTRNLETSSRNHLQRWPSWGLLLMSQERECLTRNTVRPRLLSYLISSHFLLIILKPWWPSLPYSNARLRVPEFVSPLLSCTF